MVLNYDPPKSETYFAVGKSQFVQIMLGLPQNYNQICKSRNCYLFYGYGK